MNSIVLASASPRRKQLLALLPYSFDVIVSSCDEQLEAFSSPEDFALQLAQLKAEEVAMRPEAAGRWCIGCDTVVVHKNEILGKPASAEQAITMLTALSGSTHSVITSVCLARFDGHKLHATRFAEQCMVVFSELEEADIVAYVRTGLPLDKAGAYGIQDPYGALFVERISGDYYTVVGLPVFSLYKMLKPLLNHS